MQMTASGMGALMTSPVGDNTETMEMVLNLQALEVQEDEDPFYGSSCTSTIGSGCCNN